MKNYFFYIIHALELQIQQSGEYSGSFDPTVGPKPGVKNINLAFFRKKNHQKNLNYGVKGMDKIYGDTGPDFRNFTTEKN